jgi:hypothetical protein
MKFAELCFGGIGKIPSDFLYIKYHEVWCLSFGNAAQ